MTDQKSKKEEFYKKPRKELWQWVQLLAEEMYEKGREDAVSEIAKKAEEIDDEHCSGNIVTSYDSEDAYAELMQYILSNPIRDKGAKQ